MEVVVVRCALYLRVSSAQQGAGHAGVKRDEYEVEKYGLPRQETDCRAYAREKGWTILEEHVYREVHTGARVRGRPELTRLREAAKAKQFDVILVHELSRISRNQNETGWMFSEMEHRGIRWESVTEQIDDTPFGRLVRAVSSAFAEIEREKIIERSAGGRRERIKSGKYPIAKKAKWGFKFNDEKTKARLIKDPALGDAVLNIFEMYVYEQKTPHEIAQILMQREVPTRGGGTFWYGAAVSQILRDPIYKGEAYAYRYRKLWRPGEAPKQVVAPREDWVRLADGVVEPLVDEALWNAAQERSKLNKKSAARGNKSPHAYLLRGRVFCGCCKTPLWAVNGSKTVKPAYTHHQSLAKRYGCVATTIRCHKLDAEIWQVVESVIRDPELIEKQTAFLRKEDPTRERRGLIEKDIKQTEAKYKKAIENLLFFEGDDDAKAIAMASINKQKEYLEWLRGERDQLALDYQSWQASQDIIADITQLVTRVNTHLDNVSDEFRQKIMAAFGVEVMVFPKNITPRWKLKMRLGSDLLREVSSKDIVVNSSDFGLVHNYVSLYFESPR